MTTREGGRSTVRGNWPMRDQPAILWLAAAAVAALAHPFLAAATWLTVHLLLLGALTHSAMVWSAHFSQALLKTPERLDDRRQQTRRLALLATGVILVVIGVPTEEWPLTVGGATLVSTAVLWHAARPWRRLRHALPGRFRTTVRYYIVAALHVPVGAALGAVLALELGDHWQGRLILAHSVLMLLGWIGLTVTGTLVTLWPTMLRTRMDDRAESLARQALPVLVAAVVVVAGGALLGHQLLAVAGLLAYAAGLGWWGRALLRPARSAPPRSFATWSVTAALGWAMVGLVILVADLLRLATWAELDAAYGRVAICFAVGFGAQLLSGALAHLVPSVLGGGPIAVRAGLVWFDRYATFRLTLVNLGLAVSLVPVPSLVRASVAGLVVLALAAFLPLTFLAVSASLAASHGQEDKSQPAWSPAVAAARVRAHRERRIWSTRELVGGVACVAVVSAISVLVANN
jgi:nitrite reductase (NO-forming)